MISSYELRFFRVGNSTKGGDAILLRTIDKNNETSIAIIDGGYKETGEAILQYLSSIKTTKIDLVINTHPLCERSS